MGAGKLPRVLEKRLFVLFLRSTSFTTTKIAKLFVATRPWAFGISRKLLTPSKRNAETLEPEFSSHFGRAEGFRWMALWLWRDWSSHCCTHPLASNSTPTSAFNQRARFSLFLDRTSD